MNNPSNSTFPGLQEKLGEIVAHKMASGEFEQGSLTSFFLAKITPQQKDKWVVNNTGS